MLLTISGNRVLHACISGSGLPTIILPNNLRHLRSGLASPDGSCQFPGTFFVYENAGSGASGPGPLPRTGNRIAEDLEQALAAARLRPPYIVAGYSGSGFEALLFAYRNKQDTRGLILIDPSIPFMNQTLYRFSARLQAREEEGRHGLIEALAKWKASASFSDAAQVEGVAKLECQLSEWDNLHTASSEEITAILQQPQALDPIPVIVLSASKFDVEELRLDKIRQEWYSMHAAYAHLSTNGEHRILDNCDHGSISHRFDVLCGLLQRIL